MVNMATFKLSPLLLFTGGLGIFPLYRMEAKILRNVNQFINHFGNFSHHKNSEEIFKVAILEGKYLTIIFNKV